MPRNPLGLVSVLIFDLVFMNTRCPMSHESDAVTMDKKLLLLLQQKSHSPKWKTHGLTTAQFTSFRRARMHNMPKIPRAIIVIFGNEQDIKLRFFYRKGSSSHWYLQVCWLHNSKIKFSRDLICSVIHCVCAKNLAAILLDIVQRNLRYHENVLPTRSRNDSETFLQTR
jgi:hypothetical protein